jgi:AAA ATPase domain
MSLPPLPTVWNIYNLRGSPFFQEYLQHGHGEVSLDLFVGREHELEQCRAHIHGRSSSRLAVAGPVGVGKTTLVQRLKASARGDAYLTTDELVPFMVGDTTEALFGRVLAGVYRILLANRPDCASSAAMQAAEQMVRTTRLQTGGGSVGALGLNVGVTRGVTLSTPKDILIDGPRVLADLMDIVRSSDSRGLLLHMNNLEALGSADLARAADMMLSLRDPMLMMDGLHVIVVGTTDAVASVVNTHAQVRNVFRTPLILEALALPDVHVLLDARYQARRLDVTKPARSPVDRATVDQLFAAFAGDLRGLLKALDDGVEDCIGFDGSDTSGTPVDSTPLVAPVSLANFATILQARYTAAMYADLESARAAQLTTWITQAPTATHAQKDLQQLWGISQGAVSGAVRDLASRGYVEALSRDGAQPIQYRLTGKSRVIAGLP